MIEPTSEIGAFNTQLEADLVVAKLAEAGIDAFIVADNLGGTFPMMQMITGGYKVFVLAAVADEASEIIEIDPAAAPASRHSAIYRFLARLTPTQAVAVLAALGASLAATIFAVTQGTL